MLDDNLEAAFATATPKAGQQQTFGRVRIRITTPTTGHYVITHPYGVDEFDVTDAATRNINFTEDIGVGSRASSPVRSAPGSTRSCAGTPA